MALVAWFPLISDFHNQGIDNIATVTGTNTSFVTGGKIGNCCKLGYSSNFTIPSLVNSKQISIAYWLKVNTATSTQWLDPIHYFTNSGSSDWTTRQELYSNCTLTGFWFDNGSIHGISTTVGEWMHFVITVDYEAGVAKVYKDGTLVGTSTAVNTSTKITGTSFRFGESGLDLCENDLRIYDHILSSKEVAEIAKCLVLHYPLSDPYVEGTTNLCNVQYISAGTSGGWGSHSGVVTVVDSSDFNIPCNQCNKLVITYSGSSGGGWGRGIQNINVSSSTIYTCSFYYKTSENFTKPNQVNLIYIREYNSDGTQIREAGVWNTANKQSVGNGWYRLWGTFTTQSTTVKIQPCIYVYPSSNQEYYFGCWQLEQKDHMTPYVLDNRNDTIIYDVSGYGNHGTKAGSITNSSETPRYSTSTHFDANSAYIRTTGLSTTGFGNSYSFAWWAKMDNRSYMHWGFQDGIRLNGMLNGNLWNTGDSANNPLYKPGTTTQVDLPTYGVWHHWVMTGDGTSCKVYQDGVLWAHAKTYKSISGTIIVINGWDTSTSYSSPNYSISDFRIYATALTADQVKEIYNTVASISNNGILIGYEFIEQ